MCPRRGPAAERRSPADRPRAPRSPPAERYALLGWGEAARRISGGFVSSPAAGGGIVPSVDWRRAGVAGRTGRRAARCAQQRRVQPAGRPGWGCWHPRLRATEAGGCKKLLASLQRSAGRGLALASSVRGQRWSATLPHLRTERWFPQDQHLPYYMLGNYVLHCLQLFFLIFFELSNYMFKGGTRVAVQ